MCGQGGAHTGAVLSMVVTAVNVSKQLQCVHQNLILMLYWPLPPTLLVTSEMHGLVIFNEGTGYPSIVTGLQFMGILEAVPEVLRCCRPLLLPIGITVWGRCKSVSKPPIQTLFGKLIIYNSARSCRGPETEVFWELVMDQ